VYIFGKKMFSRQTSSCMTHIWWDIIILLCVYNYILDDMGVHRASEYNKSGHILYYIPMLGTSDNDLSWKQLLVLNSVNN